MLSTKVSTDSRAQVNLNTSTNTSTIRDFIRTNPPTFIGSKVEEDPQGFIDEVLKDLDAMGMSYEEEAELAAYKLKDVSQVWYKYCKDDRPIRERPINWASFMMTFLDTFYPLELREKNIQEFMNLC